SKKIDLSRDLERELTCRAQDQSLHGCQACIDPFQKRKRKGNRLSRSRSCQPQKVGWITEQDRKCLLLDRSRILKAHFVDGFHQKGAQVQIVKGELWSYQRLVLSLSLESHCSAANRG